MMCRCLTQMFTVPPLKLLSKSPELIKTNNQTSERARTGAQMLAPPSRTAVMRTTARGITCRGRRIPRRDHCLTVFRSQSLVSLAQKSQMGLRNYKQMPINVGHPYGSLRGRRGLLNPPPRRNNQTNKEQRDPARAGAHGHGEDPWPAHMPPPHGDDGAR